MDKDPFTSTDLSDVGDYAPQTIGHRLNSIANSGEYDIEVIDSFPYMFTLEGNGREDYEEKEPDQEEESDDVELEEAYQLLEQQGELPENEAREEFNRRIEGKDFSTRMERQGELFQKFKDYRDVCYIPEESKFVI